MRADERDASSELSWVVRVTSSSGFGPIAIVDRSSAALGRLEFFAFVSLVFTFWLAGVTASQAASPEQHEGSLHAAPVAYQEMCEREPGLCEADRVAGELPGASPEAVLTPERWAELLRINAAVNATLREMPDSAIYGTSDFWTAGRTSGDCEDFMIAKKQALIDAGWAADQLLYAVVQGLETAYHAVLVVRTDRGDLVLDNLRSEIVPWGESGYRFVIRQSKSDPRRWVRIGTDRDV